jgi:mRNA-degrading endonuclease toxin of MazEF toxin-antitoxin module
VAAYCSDTGDIIWLDFLQRVANEQAGRRPALGISPLAFNSLTGRCVPCPITRRDAELRSLRVPSQQLGKLFVADVSLRYQDAAWKIFDEVCSDRTEPS